VKTLEMCFDSAQHERFRIVISSIYPFALSAVEGLRKSFHTICRSTWGFFSGLLVKRGSSMLKDLKQNWRRFKAGPPGRRFQQQFRYRQQFRSGPVRKALIIAGGILVAAAGIFFLFAPGPGIIILLIGAVMIAQESFLAARAFDRIEIHLRRFLRQSLGRWRRRRRR
jgi:Flp pilus assembly protein TadB